MSFKDFVDENEFFALKEIERSTKMTEFGDDEIVQYRFPMDGNPYSLFNPLTIDEQGHIIKLDFGYDIELFRLSKEIEKLSSLQILKIQNWSGKDFPHEFLQNLTQLEEFYIEGNLNNFPLTILRPKLKKFTLRSSLTSGTITEIPAQIKNAVDLEELKILYFQIHSIPSELCELKHLKKLDLSYCPITTIPETIRSLVNLEELFLNGTQLTKIPRDALNIPSLKKIYLCQTAIPNIKELCDKDPRLKRAFI